MKSFDEKRTAAILFCILCGIGFLYLIFKYVLGLLMPFAFAAFITLCLRRPSGWLSKKLGISHGAASFVLLAFSFLIAAALLFFAVNIIAQEGERLLWTVSVNSAKLGDAISDLFEKLSNTNAEEIPIIKSLMQIEMFRDFWENMDTFVSETVSDAAASIVRKTPTVLFSAISRLPRMLVFTAVTLISSFYLGFCGDKIFLKFPEKSKEMLRKMKRCVFDTAINYVKAAALLFLITFFLLFVGFSILGVPSPFLVAVLVALVDILPVLGVGTVLIPWGLLSLILYGDIFLGVGLFVLYAAAVTVRQLAEPKIMGKGLGLHPLVTLFSTYMGLRLCGAPGMILFPLLAGVLKTLWCEFREVDKKETL